MRLWGLFGVLLFSLAACGGVHAPIPPEDGRSGIVSDPSSVPTLLEPTFDSIKANIFEPKCLSCHASGASASNVRLDTRADLLNSPRDLVLPGDPDTSGLVIAVTRTDSKQMPPARTGAPALSAEEIATIRQWIQEGASR